MDVMDFSSYLHPLATTMYSVAEMSILNGSEVAGSICDIQSIRQGCPLSMHLFVLYIEPLLVRLAQSLQGIRVIDQTLIVRAFVDDVTQIRPDVSWLEIQFHTPL